MEQTMVLYRKTTKPMSRSYYNHPPIGQSREILFNESLYEQKGSRKASMNDECDIEDEESEFKMGRLIRQASFDSSHVYRSQQITKVMKESTSLPRYLSQKPETNEEKVIKMRKLESVKERRRSTDSMRMGKNGGGAPTILGRWIDKGSSEDMKEQIKIWARAVASNLHQEY